MTTFEEKVEAEKQKLLAGTARPVLSAADYLKSHLDRYPQGYNGTFPVEEREALRAMADRCNYTFAWREFDDKHIAVHCDRKAK